jgi:hypothetical protein
MAVSLISPVGEREKGICPLDISSQGLHARWEAYGGWVASEYHGCVLTHCGVVLVGFSNWAESAR